MLLQPGMQNIHHSVCGYVAGVNCVSKVN